MKKCTGRKTALELAPTQGAKVKSMQTIAQVIMIRFRQRVRSS